MLRTGGDGEYLSSPAVREPGERTGRYGRGTGTLFLGADGESRISAEELAVAVLDVFRTGHRPALHRRPRHRRS
ncbi:hypothetical protein ACFY2J_39665 [Streptomyces collinus]|uniref:hypothetical protein n=1 Tax=Streptomyces collinus TaxID=42684 RepID=UPI0036B01FAB